MAAAAGAAASAAGGVDARKRDAYVNTLSALFYGTYQDGASVNIADIHTNYTDCDIIVAIADTITRLKPYKTLDEFAFNLLFSDVLSYCLACRNVRDMITLVEKCMSDDRSVGVYSNYYEEMRNLLIFLSHFTSDTFRPLSQVDEFGRTKDPPVKGSSSHVRYPRNITEYVDKDGSIYMPAAMDDISVTLPSDNEVQFRAFQVPAERGDISSTLPSDEVQFRAFQAQMARTNPSTRDIDTWESDDYLALFNQFLRSIGIELNILDGASAGAIVIDVSDFALKIIGLLDPGHDINGIINDIYIRTLIDRMRVRITSQGHLVCALRCLSLVYTYNGRNRTFTLNSSNMNSMERKYMLTGIILRYCMVVPPGIHVSQYNPANPFTPSARIPINSVSKEVYIQIVSNRLMLFFDLSPGNNLNVLFKIRGLLHNFIVAATHLGENDHLGRVLDDTCGVLYNFYKRLHHEQPTSQEDYMRWRTAKIAWAQRLDNIITVDSKNYGKSIYLSTFVRGWDEASALFDPYLYLLYPDTNAADSKGALGVTFKRKSASEITQSERSYAQILMRVDQDQFIPIQINNIDAVGRPISWLFDEIQTCQMVDDGGRRVIRTLHSSGIYIDSPITGGISYSSVDNVAALIKVFDSSEVVVLVTQSNLNNHEFITHMNELLGTPVQIVTSRPGTTTLVRKTITLQFRFGCANHNPFPANFPLRIFGAIQKAVTDKMGIYIDNPYKFKMPSSAWDVIFLQMQIGAGLQTPLYYPYARYINTAGGNTPYPQAPQSLWYNFMDDNHLNISNIGNYMPIDEGSVYSLVGPGTQENPHGSEFWGVIPGHVLKYIKKYLKYKNKYLQLKNPNHKILTEKSLSKSDTYESKYMKYADNSKGIIQPSVEKNAKHFPLKYDGSDASRPSLDTYESKYLKYNLQQAEDVRTDIFYKKYLLYKQKYLKLKNNI